MNFSSSVPLPELTVQSLSPERRALVRIFQRVRFGRIPALPVRGGEPICRAGLIALRKVRVLGENGPHRMAGSGDFVLRRELREFFALLEEQREGTLKDIEIRDGLPITFEVEEQINS